jgi:hypothetical protein
MLWRPSPLAQRRLMGSGRKNLARILQQGGIGAGRAM